MSHKLNIAYGSFKVFFNLNLCYATYFFFTRTLVFTLSAIKPIAKYPSIVKKKIKMLYFFKLKNHDLSFHNLPVVVSFHKELILQVKGKTTDGSF